MSRGPFRSDEEVEELINNKNNSLLKAGADVKVKIIGSGNHGNHDRGNGKKNGSQTRGPKDQSEIAVLAELVGNKAASELTGVGETQVSQHKNGKNSNGDVKTELVINKNSKLNFLSDKAADKVNLFLEMLNEETTQDMKAREVANAAAKMADVAIKLKRSHYPGFDPLGPDNGGGRPQINYYAPVQMNIEEYITKEV